MKNKDIIVFNIQEAKDQLNEILRDIEGDPEFSEVELRIALEHAYHHMNYAWHIRDVNEERLAACSDEDFREWSKYPMEDILEYE